MYDECLRMWKEAVVDKFKILSWHLPGGTEEYYEILVRIAGLRF
jgi:hypothetical protein